MDFKNQQDAIKTYIETHLPDVLNDMGLSNFDDYIDDFIDLDLYKKSKQLFYNFNNYNFENLSNESETEDLEFSVYFAFRNNKPSELRNQMLNYSTAFYRMFDESGRNLGGISDDGIIQTLSLYPSAEGYKDIKIAELIIHLYTEK